MRGALVLALLLGCTPARPVSSVVPATVAFDRTVRWQGKAFVRLEVRFEGTTAASAQTLARDLDVVHGLIDDDLIARDALVVSNWYFDHGYLEVVVTPEVRANGDTVVVTFRVKEGAVFTLGSLEVFEDLGGGARGPALGWKTTLRPGAVFVRRALVESIRAVRTTYADLGHAYVEVNPATQLDVAQRRVSVSIPIQRGPLVQFHAITFVGHKTVSETALRKEILVSEGSTYHETRLVQSRQRLLDTGWFLSVEVSTKQGPKPDEIDVTFELGERPPSLSAPTALR